jgi:hypothetical protein
LVVLVVRGRIMTLKLEWRKWDGLANEKQQPRGLPFWAIFGCFAQLTSYKEREGKRVGIRVIRALICGRYIWDLFIVMS